MHGTAEAAAVAGITGLSITTPVGQTVHPLPEGDRYLGFLFAAGREIGEVETALRDACRKLQVVIMSGPVDSAVRRFGPVNGAAVGLPTATGLAIAR